MYKRTTINESVQPRFLDIEEFMTYTTKLFDDNSCLVGDRDVIFESVARELLGGESIEFAKRMCTKIERRFNGYGIGDYTACYLTQKEFFLAITYLNVKKQRDLGNQKKMDIDM